MKRTSLLGTLTASALLVLASCSPQAFVISPEMRGPSKSGLYLAGKSIGVVYTTDKDSRDTEFNSYLASGFASRLEEDYFGGNQLVELFQMPYSAGADYASRDSMVNLVMDTGKDVVFFIDKPELGEAKVLGANKVEGTNLPKDSSYVSVATVPFTTRIYVYDSMGKEDKVLAYSGSKEVSAEIYSDGRQDAAKLARKASTLVAPSAIKAGILAASSFLSTWKPEQFYVIYYDGAEKAWAKGAEYAYNFKWKEAITEWMKLVNHRNAEKRACACYNVALGCFMMGQYNLALEWIDRSDKDEPISLSKHLRTKIKEYSGR